MLRWVTYLDEIIRHTHWGEGNALAIGATTITMRDRVLLLIHESILGTVRS